MQTSTGVLKIECLILQCDRHWTEEQLTRHNLRNSFKAGTQKETNQIIN